MAEAGRKKVQYVNGRASRYSTAGSAAYDVGYAPGGAVKGRTLGRERVLVRPKVQVREKGEVSLFVMVGVAAIAVAAVLLLLSYTQLFSLSDNVVDLRNQVSELEVEQTRLLAEYEVSIDLKAIELAVTADGKMVKPQSEQIIYIDTYEPDSVVFYPDESAAQGAETIFDALGEIWNNIAAYFP